MSQPLEAGRALDALVAEKIFGASKFRYIDVVNGKEKETFGEFPGDSIRGVRRVPYFSTSIADAWLVVEKVDNRNAVAKKMGVLTMGLSRYDNGYTARFFNSGATADTAPLAICLAALRAVGA